MKWYYIFDMQTDECLGEILAFSVADAELEASKKFDKYSNELYALSVTDF